MHKQLIIAAFDKATKELKLEGSQKPSNLQISTHISNYLSNDFGFVFGERSLTNYYTSAITKDDTEDISMSQVKVVEGLCKYLGYHNYHEFITDFNSSDGKIDKPIVGNSKEVGIKISSKKSKRTIIILISISFVLIVGVLVAIYLNRQQWMIWNDNQYEEVDFNNEELGNGSLKVYKEERIENFKKINNADCNYKFFNMDGSVRVWYGKNKQGELELFTDIGLHPETGKSLKPITAYMIRKYLCESY